MTTELDAQCALCGYTWNEHVYQDCPVGETAFVEAKTELDPHGKAPNTPGAKLDAGKNRIGLVLNGFALALVEVGKVGTYGATKYTADGWKSVPNGAERYTDAMYRHLLREATGEALDADTGLSHAAHAAWNALARLNLILETK